MSKISEGMWVHKTQDKSTALDVVAVDYHRKTVTLSTDLVMTFDELTRDYMSTADPFGDIGGDLMMGGLLGGLDKEPIEIKLDGDDIIEIPTSTAIQPMRLPKNIDIQQKNLESVTNVMDSFNKLVDKDSVEYRMVTDSYQLSKETPTDIETNIDIVFDFDINKIAKLVDMFGIDSDKVADIILSDKDSITIMKSIFIGILEQIRNTPK